MKKSAFLFCFGILWISAAVSAQKHDYLSIFENQAQWDLKVVDYGSGHEAPITQFVKKDTTISGQGFMILQEDANFNVQNGVFIKEEGSDGKVYVSENNHTDLLYDFSLERGNKFSFRQLDFEVVSVTEIRLNGTNRKQIELKCISKLADDMIWIEGLGSTVSPLYFRNYADPDRNVKVACFFKGYNLIYSLSDQPCAKQLFAFDVIDDHLNFSLSPNPFDEQIRLLISNPSDEKVILQLFDISGKQIYQEEITAPGQNFEKRLSFPDLNSGMYLLRINTSRQQLTQKIVKY